jgi:NAD(P)-dependent dehydrogenase (short-subunit alcohol dehydrogenase family)
MTLDGVRLLVTGGSGFVGLAVAQAAIAGGAKVALFADRPPPEAFLKSAGARDAALRIGDVRSESDVADAIAFLQPTHIVHAAALTPAPDREAARARALLEVNVVGVANVMAQAAKAGVRRVVVMSSNSVYGPVSVDQGALDESRALLPADLYGISKVSAEQIAVRLSNLLGVGVAIVRLGSVYGPFEYETGLRDVMTPTCRWCARPASRIQPDWPGGSGPTGSIRGMLPAAFFLPRLILSATSELLMSAVGSQRIYWPGEHCSRSAIRAGGTSSPIPRAKRTSSIVRLASGPRWRPSASESGRALPRRSTRRRRPETISHGSMRSACPDQTWRIKPLT